MRYTNSVFNAIQIIIEKDEKAFFYMSKASLHNDIWPYGANTGKKLTVMIYIQNKKKQAKYSDAGTIRTYAAMKKRRPYSCHTSMTPASSDE